jgi:hypothetical protein
MHCASGKCRKRSVDPCSDEQGLFTLGCDARPLKHALSVNDAEK